MSTNGSEEIWVGGLKALQCHRAAWSFFLDLEQPCGTAALSVITEVVYKKGKLLSFEDKGLAHLLVMEQRGLLKMLKSAFPFEQV